MVLFHLLKGAISHLSEQIFNLNDRMDEFTSRIDAQSSQFFRTFSGNLQNTESCNGVASTSCFTSIFTNGSPNESKVCHSTSSTHLAKDSPLIEEVRIIVPPSTSCLFATKEWNGTEHSSQNVIPSHELIFVPWGKGVI